MGAAAAPELLLAGLSVRAMAEAARRDGLAVWALDLFGDADTRAASLGWQPIGRPGALQIDGPRLLAALQEHRRAAGWWPGSGFEGQPALLDEAAERLPLLGSPPAALRAVNDPVHFFGRLDAWGIAHPAVAWRRPPDAAGWLRKRAGRQGGAGVRPARPDDADPAPPGVYWQRVQPGQPMSMTLLAAAPGRAALLGLNRLWCLPQPGQPFAFGGVAGPVALPGRASTALQGVAERLVAAFDLRGLVGVDFIWHEEQAWLIEVNARWPASAALYAARGGLARAHLDACLHGRLPEPATLAAWRPAGRVGQQLLRAPRALSLSAATLAAWAVQPHVHDRPAQPQTLAAGEPLCTLSAHAADDDALQALLAQRAAALCHDLETPA